MFKHLEYIKSKLDKPIKEKGIINVGTNLNNHFSFEDAEIYAGELVPKNKNYRQKKSAIDSILGKLVEETVAYLLNSFFEKNKCNFYVSLTDTDDVIIKDMIRLLKIEKINGHIKKSMDSDVIIYNKNSFNHIKRVFVLSIKGTTRERIGQFLSHLFLMDQDVLNVKYGKNKYEVLFEKESIKLKYAFVTLDWAKGKDFTKYTDIGNKRNTVKTTEAQLVADDKKLGGGFYVLNNNENIDGIGNFATLAGAICDFLK